MMYEQGIEDLLLYHVYEPSLNHTVPVQMSANVAFQNTNPTMQKNESINKASRLSTLPGSPLARQRLLGRPEEYEEIGPTIVCICALQ